MTLTLRMALEMDSAAAKAALDDAARGIKGVTAATGEQATRSRAAAAAADSETAAKRRNAQASREMANANTQAAGATGNLVAQFNDIGVMLAAGQNPLQLAIQQGTQITQVIGNQGAAGAASLLKTAFVQMLNPLTLFTVGSIAAGAAALQWLTGATEEARTFDAAVGDLNTRADSYIRVAERARSKTAELREEFGDAANASRELFKDIAERELRELMREVAAASDALQAEIGIFEGAQFGVGNQKNLADMFDLSVWSRDAREQINLVLMAFEALDSAGTLEEQIAAAEQLKAAFSDAAIASGEISAAEDAVLGPLDEMIQKLMAARAEQDGTREAFVKTSTEAKSLHGLADQIAIRLAQAAGISLEGVFTTAMGPADQLLAKAQDILATVREAMGDFAAAPGLAYDATGKRTGLTGPDGIRAEGWGGGRFTAPVRGAGLRAAPTRRSGGGAAARDEADAVKELIATLEAEIDALRVLDPVQQEMLKYREALAGATDAERQKVEELIAARERERMLMEGAAARAEFFEQIGLQALDALIMKGESFNDVLKNIIGSLIQAIAQAALFGTGPFGSLFGGTSILSGLFPALGGGKAEGGMVHGPGTGTSDSILTPLSNGEYVVNARATARNRHLLEAINAGGRIPGFAEGGYVGTDARRMAGRGARDLPATIYMDLRGSNGDLAIEEKVRRGAAQVVSLYDREGLAVSIQRVTGDPKRRG